MRILVTALLALIVWSEASGRSLEEDVAEYVQIFSGDKSRHSDAADTFAWMGLSDPRIFDLIEKRILEEHDSVRYDRNEKNRVARYIRSLGFSGQTKYLPTIQRFKKDNVYERYAKAALEDLTRYQKWNLIISNRATFDSRLSDDDNRVMNMLRSNDILLKQVAAKRIYFGNQHATLLDMLAAEARIHYSSTDPRYSDAIAWMLKALGKSRKPEHIPLLEEARLNARDPKIQRYAQVALDYFK